MQRSVSVAIDRGIVWSRHHSAVDGPNGITVSDQALLMDVLSLLEEATAQVKFQLGRDDSEGVFDIRTSTTKVNDGIPSSSGWSYDATRETLKVLRSIDAPAQL